MQNRHPIAYESRKLRGPELLYTIYDKEILAIMHALTKFKQYLVGVKFVVRTYHNSLKYFLSQKDLNERQKKWVRKIQACNFDIEYVKGKNNVVVDASYSMTEILVDWKPQLLVEYSKNRFACDLMDG